MSDFELRAPMASDLGDHDVVREGNHLGSRRVALLVTGGIAAMKIPGVARALRRQGANVVAFTSKEATRYVTVEALEWSTVNPVVQRLTAAAEHLSDAAPFDAYLLAPATYNSINKIAAGIADGVVTSAAASALGRLEQGRAAVLVAPTMHGSLHNRILVDSLRRLHDLGVRVVPPRDAYGKHNLPDDAVLVAEVCRAVSRSRLKGRRILVTGGAIPVPIGGALRIVHRLHGALGVAIAAELHLRGAEVLLVHGDDAYPVPSFLPHRVAHSFDDHRRIVREELGRGGGYVTGVFSAAVSTRRPAALVDGGTPGEPEAATLTLVPTPRVVDDVKEAHPGLYRIVFSYKEGMTQEQATALAPAPLDHFACVAVGGGEDQEAGPSPAWLLTREQGLQPLEGKKAVAEAIADHLEWVLDG